VGSGQFIQGAFPELQHHIRPDQGSSSNFLCISRVALARSGADEGDGVASRMREITLLSMKTTKKGGGDKAGKPIPAKGLPAGWVTRDKPRYSTFDVKDSMRKYWYSPILKLQFRSRECA
jgi:hypothetical protein